MKYLCKTLQLYGEGSGNWVKLLQELLPHCLSCNKQPSASPGHFANRTQHMRLSLWSQVVNHHVWPQASCWGTQGWPGPDSLFYAWELAMFTAVQTSIISAVLTIIKKKKKKKSKLQFPFNKKARLCPIPKFLLLPSFCFQFHPLNFFNSLLYCF